jgi:hypothetical protein
MTPTGASVQALESTTSSSERYAEKELQLRGISTITDANAHAPSFIAACNARFATPPCSRFDAHWPLRDDEDLDLLTTWRETRRATKSLTVQYDRVMYLLDDQPANCKLVHRYVDISFRFRQSRTDAERRTVNEDISLCLPCFVPIIDGGAGFVLKCTDRHQGVNLGPGESEFNACGCAFLRITVGTFDKGMTYPLNTNLVRHSIGSYPKSTMFESHKRS